ncbi:hypothetical protein Zm00014a_027393 [Zea mays]|uniref:Uncharacterized protein n=2 Tax=Zea mays TaxID=4577 RepID=B6SSS3_MAIZE|nr:hypothetical protein [Zea mays]PWZ11407.1 hypothetical protein Zm00014a_027393 [Zea mays]|eukprot:NP_001142964.1 uncharacterized protein LOC100275415 [Zea mays]
MGIQVAAVVTPPPCSSPSSSTASPSSSAIATSPRHAVLGARLARSQSSLACWNAGLGRRRGGIRRALSASIDSVGSGGGEDEEFLRRIQELAAGQHPGGGGCGWPASVERNASSVGLPLSLRMLKRRKQQQQLEQGRWNERLIDCAGESARAAVGRAFSSMVLIIRELQSFTLQMREAVVYEDLQGVLARVHAEMHASFVWLFQHIFSGTPALMVSLMLLLANFTVYSMGDSVAAAASLVPPQAAVEMVDIQQQPEQQQSHSQQRFDTPALKTFSTGRTASVGGNGDGGGKVRPVAGATGDGQSDESSHRQNGAVVLPQDLSQSQATPLASVSDSMAVEDAQAQETVQDDELAIWKRISDEAARMQASVRAEELMDPETLEQLVAPVEAPKPDTVHYSPEHVATAQRYEQALSEEPNSSLLLANFAQFLYQVQGDLDRAEHFFKRAARAEPADAEALGRYAAFLWQARDDLAAAEETYQEAIAADPGNAHHAAAYAHFLWNTGGEDTCYPLD